MTGGNKHDYEHITFIEGALRD